MGYEDIINAMIKDKRVRLNIIKRSHKFFFYFYFSHYTESPIAYFHEEMFRFTENIQLRTIVIAGFRGCGKSALMAMSFPLWAILGEQKIKYVLILSKTEQKAQTMLQQVKYELENNELLKKDRGPFHEERNNQWNTISICLDRYNAKITAGSTEQSFRSFRHMQYRPQLIIADDLEDLESVKTLEGRDKLYNWLVSDVIPAGGKNTRLAIIGGILHEDSVLKRLQKSIDENKMDGVYREYPFLDENGIPTWKERFKTQKDIDDEKRKIGNESAFLREYQLRPSLKEDQIIKEEWLRSYDCDHVPENESEYIFSVVSIDPAVSSKKSSDFTAIICADVYGRGNNKRIYIKPNIINNQITFHEMKEIAKDLSKKIGRGCLAKIYIEDAGQQGYIIQDLMREGYPATGIRPLGDKSYRLNSAGAQFQAGRIFLPKNESPIIKKLKQQILYFGIETHDDLTDACTQLINQVITEVEKPTPKITVFSFGPDMKDYRILSSDR